MEKGGDEAFGTRLRRLRLQSGLSQEALAERARLSVDGIGALERGVRRAPQRQTIALIAAALGLSEHDRLGLENAAVRPRRLPQGLEKAADSSLCQNNLPLTITSFLGRDGERAMIGARVLDHRLVTLTGVGGVGKTRLALEAARDLINRFRDGVWLIELAPLADESLVSARVAATLGIIQGLEKTTSDAWIAALASKHLLVVFDNCEHILATAAALSQRILERCANVHILATSREPLRIRGERVHRLDALELPRGGNGELPSIDDLRSAPAIQMFFDRARDVAPDFAIEDRDVTAWRALQTVCTRLDGMPLAIELAAARLSAMSLQAIAGTLDRRFDLLTGGNRAALPRQRTLRALLDWSHDLLSDSERMVMRRLAVFAGGWTLDAAESVCASDRIAAHDVLPILVSLVDKSLVVADTVPAVTRYRLLETTRAYALEHLIARDEYASLSERHALYCLRFLQNANKLRGGPSVSAWLAPLEVELDNVRAALQWSLIDSHDAALAARIARALYPALESLSLFAEGVQWCERALLALGSGADPALEAPLQVALGILYARRGHAVRGLAASNRAVELYTGMRNDEAYGHAHAALVVSLALVGRHLAFLGRNDEAGDVASKAVAIARKGGIHSALAFALYVKTLTVNPRDLATRRALLAEALEYCDLSPDSFVSGIVLLGIGHAEFDAGDFTRARAYARDAMDHYRRNGRDEDLAIWASSLAAIAASSAGDLEQAYRDAEQALQHARRGLDVKCAVLIVADVAAARGLSELSAGLIGASDALFHETILINIPYMQTLYRRTLNRLQKAVGEERLQFWIEQGRAWTYEEAVAASRGLQAEL